MRTRIRKKLDLRRLESLKEKEQRKKEVARLLKRLGTYLRSRREREDLTFRAFAARAQIAHSNIYLIEQSKKDPHLSELVKLAQAFNQSLRDFLEPLFEDEKALDAVADCAQPREKFTEIVMAQKEVPPAADGPKEASPEES